MSQQPPTLLLPLVPPARTSSSKISTTSSNTSTNPLEGHFYRNGSWTSEKAMTLQRVTETAQNRNNGLEIMFLPKVDSDEVKLMKDAISSAFGVPAFFWTTTGHKANGFFNHNKSPLSQFSGATYGTMSRFLIKEIQPKLNTDSNEYTYKWQYISFILLCFDLSAELKVAIRDAFMESTPATWRNCPLGLYSVILPIITNRFDGALWGFKNPIRDIENTRIEHQTTITGNIMQERYIRMHELSRHVIHEVETLDVSARTVASIVEHHQQYHHDACHDSLGFDFHQRFLENLRSRAEAFEKRLQNEITLAFNLAAADDNAVANETQKDGRELTQLVSTATLLFLPGSFVSSFFGMNFFDFGSEKIATSKQIYIFVVSTVVVTVIGFYIWKRFGGRQRKVKTTNPPAPFIKRLTTGFV